MQDIKIKYKLRDNQNGREIDVTETVDTLKGVQKFYHEKMKPQSVLMGAGVGMPNLTLFKEKYIGSSKLSTEMVYNG